MGKGSMAKYLATLPSIIALRKLQSVDRFNTVNRVVGF